MKNNKRHVHQSPFKSSVFLTLIVSLFLLVGSVWSAPVGREVADGVAQDWAYLHGWHLEEAGWTPMSQNAEPKTEFAGELKDQAGEVVAFKYRFPTGGNVVVVNEDGLAPVFFYSETNTFDPNANPTARYLFDAMVASLKCAREKQTTPHTGWSGITTRAKGFRTNQILAQTLASTTIGPLVQTTWNQAPLYNNFCPDTEHGRCYVGCTATAMSQILKYWEKPQQLTPNTIEYTTTYVHEEEEYELHIGPEDISSNPLDWANMPIELGSGSSQTQIDAVAWLSYVCGLTVHMGYGPDGSGGPTVSAKWPDGPNAEKAFRNIFGYENAFGILREDYGRSWEDIMRNQIERGQPVLYSGYTPDSGHAFILDGVKEGDDGDLFHFNLGWGGNSNGWYSSTDPLSYSEDQDAIIEIYQGDSYSLSVTASPQEAGAIMQNTSRSGNTAITEGTVVQLRALPFSGYVFSHWAGDGTGTSKTTTITMDSDKSVIAVFEPGYQISMHCHGEGMVSYTPDANGFASGETVTVQANPAAGWKFDHWEGDVTGSETSATLTMDRDKIVHAYFVQSYNMLIVPTGQGTVSRDLAGPGYKPGTRVTLTATPAEGWVFRKWWGDVDSTDNPVTVAMDDNKLIQAEFVNPAMTNYTLTVSTVGDGQAVPFGGSFVKGSTVSLTATPGAGCRFVQWRGDIVSTSNPLEVTMDANTCVTAVFCEQNAEMPADETVQGDGTTNDSDGSTPAQNSATTTEKDSEFELNNLFDSCTLLATVVMTLLLGGFGLLRIKE